MGNNAYEIRLAIAASAPYASRCTQAEKKPTHVQAHLVFAEA